MGTMRNATVGQTVVVRVGSVDHAGQVVAVSRSGKTVEVSFCGKVRPFSSWKGKPWACDFETTIVGWTGRNGI